jgi:hypothetical protein
VALKLETTVFTHLFTMNMATYSSAKFSTVLGILLGQFENYTLQASRQNLKLISLHNSLEEWFDNARMVGNIDVINGAKAPIMLTYTGLEICSMTTESGWKDWVEVEVVSAIMNLATVCVGDSAWTIFVSQFTASGITTGNIMGRSMDAFAAFPCSVSSPMSQDPYSLASLTKEDLQSLTNACAVFFNVTMAINNSASFNTVGGVQHWHSGDFPYSGKCSSLKKLISLLNVLRNGLTTPGWWSRST